MNESQVYSITELNEAVRGKLEGSFFNIQVEGEISNLAKPASGHLYFTLKDKQSSISCALFKGKRFAVKIPWQDIKNGLQIKATGNVSLYSPRGQYQFIVNSIKPAGLGLLEQQYQQTLEKLHAEGLFDTSHKKQLPEHINTIGIITSKTGAAIHDAITTLKRRNPYINVIVYPTLVQGKEAAAQIKAQLEIANKRHECDVLLFIRGGGSLEDLWAFNDEQLAREIVATKIPTISGVGHEIDFTICDFACDIRAATPTAAAELACPQLLGLLDQYQQKIARINQRFRQVLAVERERLNQLYHQVKQSNPERQLQFKMQKLDDLQNQFSQSIRTQTHYRAQQLQYLNQQIRNSSPRYQIQKNKDNVTQLSHYLKSRLNDKIEQKQQKLQGICSSLSNLSPLNVLSRGYAFAKNENNKIIYSASDIAPKSKIKVQLHEGKLHCTVDRRSLK